MLFAAISLPLHNNMTKIVHEFCGICIQRRDIAGCFSGVWGGGLRFGEESCLCGSSYTLGMLHLFCIARHSLLVVGRVAGSNHSPPVRRRGVQRNSLSPRQVPPAAVALRNAPAGAALSAPAVFASLRDCAAWPRRQKKAGDQSPAAKTKDLIIQRSRS